MDLGQDKTNSFSHLGFKTKARDFFVLITDGFFDYLDAFKYPRNISFRESTLMPRTDRSEFKSRQRSLRELQTKKIIEIEKKGREIEISLTENGKTQYLINQIILNKKFLSKKQVLVVSFDIPDRVSHIRRYLRSLLREAGFVKRHQSVWETKHDIVDELKELVKRLKLTNWIQLYLAKRV
ncbi:hypothetical protein ACFLZY_02440 [Patescibacteria group bacterium]